MKKKSLIIGIIVVIVVVTSIYLLTHPKSLANMNHRYAELATATSTVSFLAEAGDSIKFSFRSTIESGDLDIILYDSEGNAVYKLDRAKELETFFNLSKSDTYTLAAECSSFIGEFNIRVYKVN